MQSSLFDSMWYAMKAISSMEGVVGVWRAFVYNLFAFVGGIVLINLLIAILGDAYDRSKLNEKAELTRHRAAIAGDVVSSITHHNDMSNAEHRLSIAKSLLCVQIARCGQCLLWMECNLQTVISNWVTSQTLVLRQKELSASQWQILPLFGPRRKDRKRGKRSVEGKDP